MHMVWFISHNCKILVYMLNYLYTIRGNTDDTRQYLTWGTDTLKCNFHKFNKTCSDGIFSVWDNISQTRKIFFYKNCQGFSFI